MAVLAYFLGYLSPPLGCQPLEGRDWLALSIVVALAPGTEVPVLIISIIGA